MLVRSVFFHFLLRYFPWFISFRHLYSYKLLAPVGIIFILLECIISIIFHDNSEAKQFFFLIRFILFSFLFIFLRQFNHLHLHKHSLKLDMDYFIIHYGLYHFRFAFVWFSFFFEFCFFSVHFWEIPNWWWLTQFQIVLIHGDFNRRPHTMSHENVWI